MDAQNCGSGNDIDLLAEQIAEICTIQGEMMAIPRKYNRSQLLNGWRLPAVGLRNRWQLPALGKKRKGPVERGFRRLAAEITRFGKIYWKVEQIKLRETVEFYKKRMQDFKDLQNQKIQEFIESQRSLANCNSDNKPSLGESSYSYDPIMPPQCQRDAENHCKENPQMRQDNNLLAEQMAVVRRSQAVLTELLKRSQLSAGKKRNGPVEEGCRSLAKAITRFNKISKKVLESNQQVKAELEKQFAEDHEIEKVEFLVQLEKLRRAKCNSDNRQLLLDVVARFGKSSADMF